jgi:hypothetical protein
MQPWPKAAPKIIKEPNFVLRAFAVVEALAQQLSKTQPAGRRVLILYEASGLHLQRSC